MKYSIVTPIYNTPSHYLRNNLNSLLKIGDKNSFEVIYINDGGECPEIDFNSYDLNINYITYETNRGPGYARQVGINNAKGDYVIFCDSDDNLSEGALAEYSSVIAESSEPVDVIYSCTLKIQDDYNKNPDTEVNNGFPDNIHGLCINVDFLKKHQIAYSNSYYHEDGFFTLDCAYHHPNVKATHNNTIVHRNRENSLSMFQNTEIYDISLIVSTIKLYNKLAVPTFIYRLENENNCIKDEIINRVCSELRHETSDIGKALVTFYYACIWNTLDHDTQVILSERGFNVDSVDVQEFSSNIVDFVHTAYANDNNNIQNYFIECLQEAYHFHNTLLTCPTLFEPVTIVVPTYNNSDEELCRALTSINEQIATRFIKVLIVDDGSNEPVTIEKISQYLPDVQFRIERLHRNVGVGAARNKGLHEVDTPYMMIFDMDDYIANKYVVWHFLSMLTEHQELFGVRGWEYWVDRERVISEDFYVSNTLHGLFCRVQPLRDNHIQFLPLQYAEDGLFIIECGIHNLRVDTLHEVFYARCTGHLTNNVENSIGNLNNTTDNISFIKQLSIIYNQEASKEDQANEDLLTRIESNLIAQIEHLTDTTMFVGDTEDLDHRFTCQMLRDNYMDLETRQIWSTYLWTQGLMFVPVPLLFKLRNKNRFADNAQFLHIVDNILMQLEDYYIPATGATMTLPEIEVFCKRWYYNRIESLKDDPRAYIPRQAIKHIPWNYTSYMWM